MARAAVLVDQIDRQQGNRVVDDIMPDAAGTSADLWSPADERATVADRLRNLLRSFSTDLASSGMRVDPWLADRFILSLATRRFVILSGLSGSGKTKLAQAFGAWISAQSDVVDPFHVGAVLQGGTARYVVIAADSIAIDLASEQKTTGDLVLSRRLIQDAVDLMRAHGFDRTTSPREIRNALQATKIYSSQLVSHESHIKAAAVALLEAQRTDHVSPSYLVVPVGSDWTGSDNVLGYSDPLDADRYVAPPVLRFILQAIERKSHPHVLVLDEMNLSHVERYFADLLSAIESGEPIELHAGDAKADGMPIPMTITIPSNLFVVGTVNVDETTYAFSPKVLDRSSVIEFRVASGELAKFVAGETTVDLTVLSGHGVGHARAFLQASSWEPQIDQVFLASVASEIEVWNAELAKHRREFAFRTAREIKRFVGLSLSARTTPDGLTSALDAAMCQKVLPRLSGSRRELEQVLVSLLALTGSGRAVGQPVPQNGAEAAGTMYPISAAKLERMLDAIRTTGFAAFAEG